LVKYKVLGIDMSDTPFVSIIVPLYNYEKYISDCITSITNQTYDNYELIVVDDCSTDKSYKIAKKFKSDKVKIIRLEKNQGYSKAKNEGIILSKGEYITTLDADDMMTKNSLEVRVKAAVEHDVPFVHANAIRVKGGISLKKCYNLEDPFIQRHPSIYEIHAQTIFIKRDIFKQYGLFDENLRSRSDREMWWRLFGKPDTGPPKIKSFYVDECVAYYRFHSLSMWRTRKRNKKLDQKVIKKSEQAYDMRQREGITKNNTRFLEI
jgi:glycosyltransferase involved in cell wall biosynthesis